MAPQFTWITEELGLCWVHEGRHYKKLFPYVAQHQKLLEDFLGDFWDFYRELLAYRQQPTPGERKRLERRFDALFATKTGYWALDERDWADPGQEDQPTDGAGPPGNPAPQQLGGTGRKTAGAKAEDQFWASGG